MLKKSWGQIYHEWKELNDRIAYLEYYENREAPEEMYKQLDKLEDQLKYYNDENYIFDEDIDDLPF